jgi:hypothetical protein
VALECSVAAALMFSGEIREKRNIQQ